MNKKTLSILLLTTLLGFAPSSIVVSEAQAEAGRQGGFSQLDFDRAAALSDSNEPSKNQLSEILGERSEKQAQSEKPSSSPSNQDATARARLGNPQASAKIESAKQKQAEPSISIPDPRGSLRFDWVKPESGNSHFLVPRLKGPFVDKSNQAAITSVATWKPQGNGCQDVSTAEGLCKKSKALKEVMNRFSGSDDFFNEQCPQTCSNDNEMAVLSAFAVKSIPDGEFKMESDKSDCRYSIQSRVLPAHWQMLAGERGVCSCLPKSCLN